MPSTVSSSGGNRAYINWLAKDIIQSRIMMKALEHLVSLRTYTNCYLIYSMFLFNCYHFNNRLVIKFPDQSQI